MPIEDKTIISNRTLLEEIRMVSVISGFARQKGFPTNNRSIRLCSQSPPFGDACVPKPFYPLFLLSASPTKNPSVGLCLESPPFGDSCVPKPFDPSGWGVWQRVA